MTGSMLAQPQISQVLFHPRPEPGGGSAIPDARPILLEVEPGISLGGWLFPAEAGAPVVLFFHGNGEIAADYDFIAPAYTELGLSLLVMDYRGYGSSNGQPTATHLLADAVTVFEVLEDLWQSQQLSPDRLYVMGRSLGSAAAIEVAVQAGEQLAGLIIESGFADTIALLTRLGAPVSGLDESQAGFGNAVKMARVTRPTLIVHGQNDVLIPALEGEMLYRHSGAADKRLVLIPGAGHNDLLLYGRNRYFEAIAAFIG
jgi:alpha-beta hydrolase superfamily lysophospholipase